jgi:cbb3-type cytochrome oxidase subunit 3
MKNIWEKVLFIICIFVSVLFFMYRKRMRQRLSTERFDKMFLKKKDGFDTITLYNDLHN